MQWQKDNSGRPINPYRVNHFSILGVAPESPLQEIALAARELSRKLNYVGNVTVAGQKVEKHQVDTASEQLRKDDMRLREALLIPPPPETGGPEPAEIAAKLQEAAALDLGIEQLPLAYPLAVLQFLPDPGSKIVKRPHFDDLGLVQAGDPDDLVFDIEFDR